MTESWSALMDAAGARRDSLGIRDFGPTGEQQHEGNQLFALDYLGSLLVRGPDARKFLQGQVTCDMNLVSEDHAQPGAHCNTKGRAVFSFQALQLSGESDELCIALILPRPLVARAQQALQKFIVFSKAKLSTEASHQLVGLAGSGAAALLAGWIPRLPIGKDDVIQAETGACLRIAAERFLCLLPNDLATATWGEWAKHCRLEGHSAWHLANIRAGLGEVLPGSEEEFIPQMLNMQITGGISFNKGCYIGQEVVARMQYLGKLKRHMRRLNVQGVDLPAPGTPVYSTEAESSVGNIVLAAPAENDWVEMLAVTTDSAFESESLFLDAEKTRKLHNLALPYAITK